MRETAVMDEAGALPREARLGRQTWLRFWRAVRNFVSSDVGRWARWMGGALLVLLLAITGLNVVNSYVGRDFMTAIEQRDRSAFLREAALYIGVFAASTVVAVLFRFTEERLGLLWREWLTRRSVDVYLSERIYHRLNTAGTIENPDQRIAEDVRTFVTMTLSLLLMLLNGTITVIAFSGVLWSISRVLFLVGVGYAAAGSAVTVLFGRPLVRLNYAQADREANFRAELIHVREHAESVALLRREPHLEMRLRGHIEALVANLKRIIAVNRNLGFFTTGYNYFVQIIPALIVAPLFIRGEVEFGVITQSAMAFSHLLGAFSLVVTQFQAISAYGAVLARVSALAEATETIAAERAAIEVVEEGGRLAYERLTLRSPRDGRILVRELSVSVAHGTRLLIRARDDTAKVALFRATAGMWGPGEGRVIVPAGAQLAFVPERPYLPPGTLRQLLAGGPGQAPSDERIMEALRTLRLEGIVARAGGLDVERNLGSILSLSEQQLLCVARLLLTKPRFAFLDRVGTALETGEIGRVLRALAGHGITYLGVGNAEDDLAFYDAVLDVAGDGAWTWKAVREGKLVDDADRGAATS
jgi:putative ATP-binding cassette transporter